MATGQQQNPLDYYGNNIRCTRNLSLIQIQDSQRVLAIRNELTFIHSTSSRNSSLNASRKKQIRAGADSLNDFHMYIWLMSQADSNITKRLGNFCKSLEKI